MGGRIELKWMEKRQGFASRCVKLDDKDCKVGKEGELGSPPAYAGKTECYLR